MKKMTNQSARKKTIIRKKNHLSYTEGIRSDLLPSFICINNNLLIRRDTPHHLKNKRVQQGLLTDKAANLIISNALKQQEHNLKLVENIIPEDAEKDDHPVESGE